ncbi:class I SAM-dependent methyltransferase [Kutzneria sp. NPDC051319]|uniref:class I SAM-dependent methyltransferase n=1 Tax=Kutzneria sp. NPDC051319 TaxID=3155047 RepID=UPI0034152448
MPEAAELYNAMNPWSGRGDDRFYLDLVLGADAVLDVGCGTGTLLSKAREAGHTGRLVGFDPDADMLAQAPGGLDLSLGDMSTPRWDGEFDLAVMTGHAFQCLLTDSDVLTTLRGVRDALKPGGRFVFETRNPVAREWEQWPKGGFEFPWEGEQVRVFYEVRPIVGDVVDVVENIVADGWQRADAGQLRFLSAERLAELVAEAGLSLEEQYGTWDRDPFTPDSAEIISVLRRA